MRKVWKFELNIGPTTLEMPIEAEVVYVDIQAGVPTLWALVDPELPTGIRRFCVRGTGHPILEGEVYVGTWQSPPYMWHLFEATA